MAQDYSEAAALKAAKEAVARLETMYPGDPNKVMGKLAEMQSKNPLSKIPTADEIFKQRVSELANAYASASDGHGGIDKTNKRAAEKFSLALDGKTPNGAFLPSQQLAIHTGRLGQLTESVTEILSKYMGRLGIPGKAVAGLAAVTFAVGANAGEITPRQALEAGLNGAFDGLGTVTVGEGSTRGKLCKAFGEAAVPAAAGLGAGLVGSLATPAVGIAAGVSASAAASATLSEPATNACNKWAQRLGF